MERIQVTIQTSVTSEGARETTDKYRYLFTFVTNLYSVTILASQLTYCKCLSTK